MPAGCISIKRVRGRAYAYRVWRAGAGLRFRYEGRADADGVQRLRHLMEERRLLQKERRQAQNDLVRVQRYLALWRFAPGGRKSSAFEGLPVPVSRDDLGEVAPRVRASKVLAEGRRSFAFL